MEEHLLASSIQPIQSFAYTTGKNATDAALIIDAMDLLHSGRFDGFCIVSSDSDFTRLAVRLRESGMVVYGFGEDKTPEPFAAVCDMFVQMNVDRPDPAHPQARIALPAQLTSDTRLVNSLLRAVRPRANAIKHAAGHRATLVERQPEPREES